MEFTKSPQISPAALLSVLAFIGLVCALFLVANQRDEIKKEAVVKGFAEFIVTPDREIIFKWKE